MNLQLIDYGPLDTVRVSTLLGLNLANGNVVFSKSAQLHAIRRHPADFTVCISHLQRLISTPDFIGRGPKQRDGFEMVAEIPNENAIILVAIKLLADANGNYRIASTYLISRNSLERRLRKKFLART